MPTKSQMTTIAMTLVALAIVNNVAAAAPIKRAIMGNGA